LLEPVEEALDQVASAVQACAKADKDFTISLRRNVGPRTVFTGECSDPVCVISSISEQHRACFQIRQQIGDEPVIVGASPVVSSKANGQSV
jgi:hypothetical protein